MDNLIENLIHQIAVSGNQQGELRQISAMAKAIPVGSEASFLRHLLDASIALESAQSGVEVALLQLANDPRRSLNPDCIPPIRELYRSIQPQNNIRNNLLYWLGSSPDNAGLECWLDLITQSPPSNPHGLVQVFSPLVKRSDLPIWFFEKLANEGISHPEIAAACLDLMNFHTRQQTITPHPARSRAEQLTSLLGNVVQQMARVEEGNVPTDLTPQEISQRVSESVALTVSLCDALALMKFEPAIGKLNQAMELKHRRIRTEAAAALASLGEDEGKQALIKLAEEPVARLRVLSFAQELDILEDIDESLQSEIAIAESKLANFLAQPTQMGVPPSTLELLDNREMYWPSYEHPVQCYLFRFQYGAEGGYSNIGIVGPLVHAFATNIESLDIDDVYAAFAGWQAEHPEIFQLSIDQARQSHSAELTTRYNQIEDKGFDEIQPEFVGSFFGEFVLITVALRNHESVVVLADSQEVFCFSSQSDKDRLDSKTAYMIWRGRKLIEQFND